MSSTLIEEHIFTVPNPARVGPLLDRIEVNTIVAQTLEAITISGGPGGNMGVDNNLTVGGDLTVIGGTYLGPISPDSISCNTLTVNAVASLRTVTVSSSPLNVKVAESSQVTAVGSVLLPATHVFPLGRHGMCRLLVSCSDGAASACFEITYKLNGAALVMIKKESAIDAALAGVDAAGELVPATGGQSFQIRGTGLGGTAIEWVGNTEIFHGSLAP